MAYYRIDLSNVPSSLVKDTQESIIVTPDSPLTLRRQVERFAIYFRREFRYDAQQFEATETPDKPYFVRYMAHLFICEPTRYPRVWVGACCFRWREYDDLEPRWAAQWMWLHPYFRNKGILSRAWDTFHNLYGDFYSEGPFSPAMNAFLRKRGNCILCWQPIDMPDQLVCARCYAQHAKSTKTDSAR
jgi:hypothetical protein